MFLAKFMKLHLLDKDDKIRYINSQEYQSKEVKNNLP
jgi:hypothetical protein